MKKFMKILKALSDENRLRIVNLLYNKMDLCVCEITEIIGLSQPTISSNLKKLEEAEIVECFKDGLWVNYNLSKNMSGEIRKIIISILEKVKDESLLKEDILKVNSITREGICKKYKNQKSGTGC